MKTTILTILAFIGFSISVLAQDKKMDSLFGDFEGSVMKSSQNIFEKHNNGCIFSMKIVVSPAGSVKSLAISNNIEKDLVKDYLVKNKSRLKLDYFKEMAWADKLKADATYIVPVIWLNDTYKAKIEFDNVHKLLNIYNYDDEVRSLKNVTIIKPCIIISAIYQ